MPQLALPCPTGLAARTVTALIVALGCSACTIAPQYAANAADLEASYNHLQGGQLQQAAGEAELILARTSSPKLAPDYARQRYYAAVLVMLAHESASFAENQFLKEDGRYLSTSIGGQQGSPLSHLTAAAYHASYAWLSYQDAQADGAGSEDGADPMIPAALSALDLQTAQNHLYLTLAMAYTRLGFTSRCNDHLRTVNRALKLSDIDTFNELMASAQVPDSAKPWIYYAAFRYLAGPGGDETEAYRFGISARNAASNLDSGFERVYSTAIADWIENDSAYTFTCIDPEETPFSRTEDSCGTCYADSIDYEAILKPTP